MTNPQEVMNFFYEYKFIFFINFKVNENIFINHKALLIIDK